MAERKKSHSMEVLLVDGRGVQPLPDELAIEAALEMRLSTDAGERPLAVTMRTPGNDEELATGFLFSENVIDSVSDITGFSRPTGLDGDPLANQMVMRLREGLEPDPDRLERHFFATSACGVCGKARLDAVGATRVSDGPEVEPSVLHELPERLRSAQGTFQRTGGLHAAALFTAAGELLAAREDVGRHNALDKLIGWALADERVPLDERILLLSGRASYELVQKAARAGIPIVAAVSAPSSLAVALAEDAGITLVGFLRDGRFNVYVGAERLRIE
jgi:FdhD protein